jgi:hypothetical protein
MKAGAMRLSTTLARQLPIRESTGEGSKLKDRVETLSLVATCGYCCGGH